MRRLSFLLLALLLAGLACRTAPAPAPPSRKVVMLSLDGADAVTLHRLRREGLLDAGGFARFFAEGLVADRLEPVNPTNTGPNHITLATGYRADETGIVANYLRLPGMPLTQTATLASLDIQTETLWEAARRQGLRVAVSAWPGADDRDSRRRADWGMTYIHVPERGAELVTLPLAQWTHPLREGEWLEVPCRTPADRAPASCRAKLLDVDRERGTVRVYFGAEYRIPSYPAGFGRALRDAGVVWSGPPDTRRLGDAWEGRPGIDLATWTEQVERFGAFFTDVLLAAARYSDWDLLMSYTPVLDEAGHQLLLVDPRQPGYTAERSAELDRARVRIWQSVDRDLARLLGTLDLRTTTVLVVSDHGMAPTHTRIDLDVLLRDWGLLRVGPDGRVLPDSVADSIGGGGFTHLYLRPGLPEDERSRILRDLRERLSSWKIGDERPIATIVTRDEAAAIGLGHPSTGDLFLLAAPGYNFRDDDQPLAAAAVTPTATYGRHGFSNDDPRMQGIYLALGAGVEKGSAGIVSARDVAGRVADWLGIEKPRREPPATSPAP